MAYANLGYYVSLMKLVSAIFWVKNRKKIALIFSPISFCVVPYFFLGFGLAEKFPYYLQFYWIFYRWLVNSKLEALWSEIGDSIRKLNHNQRPILYPSWFLDIGDLYDLYLKNRNSFWGDQITKMITLEYLLVVGLLEFISGKV